MNQFQYQTRLLSSALALPVLAFALLLFAVAVPAAADDSDVSRWTFAGELDERRPSVAYRLHLKGSRDVSAELGDLAVDAELQIVDERGEIVHQGEVTGLNGRSLNTRLPAGKYQVRVAGASSTSYSLAVTSAPVVATDEDPQDDADAEGNRGNGKDKGKDKVKPAGEGDPVGDAPAIVSGDFNGDGLVDDRDIELFVRALSDPETLLAEYPELTAADLLRRGDINGDGQLDAADVAAFEQLVTAQRDEEDASADDESVDTATASAQLVSDDSGTVRVGGSPAPRTMQSPLSSPRGSGGGSGGGSGNAGGQGNGAPTSGGGSAAPTSPPSSPDPTDDTQPTEPEQPVEPEPVQTEEPVEPEPMTPEQPVEPEPEELQEPQSSEPSELEGAVESVSLVSGSGFEGETTQPSHVGTGFGADAQAIARWNVVPEQTVTGRFNVGVLAFHMLGIERVSFSVEGGPWVDVAAPSLNTQTGSDFPQAYDGTNEYWVALDAADLPVGRVEVRAIAYPVKGLPRVLEPLQLWANLEPGPVVHVSLEGSDEAGDGSRERPYASIVYAAHKISHIQGDRDASGGVIRLLPGEHRLGTHAHSMRVYTKRWLTIEPAEGVSRAAVKLAGSSWPDGLPTQHLRLRNLTITGQMISKDAANTALWIDRCELIGRDRIEPNKWHNGFVGGVWATNTLTRESRNGPGAAFSRNLRIEDIGENAWMDPQVVIDSYATRIDRPANTEFHMDVVHLRGRDNVILYGVRADEVSAQGIFTKRDTNLRNTAIVKCQFDNTAGGNQRVFQMMGPTEHLLVQGSTFVGACNWRVDEGFTAYNVMLRNSTFNDELPFVPSPYNVEGVHYEPSPWLYD